MEAIFVSHNISSNQAPLDSHTIGFETMDNSEAHHVCTPDLLPIGHSHPSVRGSRGRGRAWNKNAEKTAS